MGAWTTIIKTRPPVETRSFGVIMPYRDVVQVRRIAEPGEAAGGSEARERPTAPRRIRDC
ncbi:hypothetical protein AB0K52_16500 [Glycomyces sp. NPDC049804]|uniref:hypothetical protein n=1 Tax=Glycomyces sp. NPDC049804 TaxID=3154363 RepID=UPI0034418AA3